MSSSFVSSALCTAERPSSPQSTPLGLILETLRKRWQGGKHAMFKSGTTRLCCGHVAQEAMIPRTRSGNVNRNALLLLLLPELEVVGPVDAERVRVVVAGIVSQAVSMSVHGTWCYTTTRRAGKRHVGSRTAARIGSAVWCCDEDGDCCSEPYLRLQSLDLRRWSCFRVHTCHKVSNT